MGVSGGAKGALEGPSMMPGGTKTSYDAIESLLNKMAAQVEDGPCVTYIGPGGSGHLLRQFTMELNMVLSRFWLRPMT